MRQYRSLFWRCGIRRCCCCCCRGSCEATNTTTTKPPTNTKHTRTHTESQEGPRGCVANYLRSNPMHHTHTHTALAAMNLASRVVHAFYRVAGTGGTGPGQVWLRGQPPTGTGPRNHARFPAIQTQHAHATGQPESTRTIELVQLRGLMRVVRACVFVCVYSLHQQQIYVHIHTLAHSPHEHDAILMHGWNCD